MPIRLCALSLCLICLAGGVKAFEAPEVEVRLLEGGKVGDRLLAGVEIEVPSGWKTYWRSPGDSGIPPRFDFSGSDNVSGVTVEWPAPELHHDGYGAVIGYDEPVVFPLLVTPQEASAPVELEVSLSYAVCSDICVPMEARLSGDPAQPGERARIAAFRDLVPEPLPASRSGVSVERQQDGEGAKLVFSLPADEGAEPVLLAERVDGGYLPQPRPEGRVDGDYRYVMDLEGRSGGGALSGKRIRLTAVRPGFSFEQELTVD